MIVAIDGPAGSGKSTVARELARREGLTYLDTGAMYRAVTQVCLERGTNLEDDDAVATVAREIRVDFVRVGDEDHVTVDGRDLAREIRMPEVDRAVSRVSAVPAVREAMVARQRELASAGDVVAEGRDVGTTVFPSAPVKVFLTADVAARAHRRAVQREGGDAGHGRDLALTEGEERDVQADLERRDHLDSSREVSPLRAAADAVHLDSTGLSVDEVCGRISGLMAEVREGGRA